MRKKHIICILLLITIILVGCSTEDREAVQGTINKYYDGFVDGNLLQIGHCLHSSFEGWNEQTKEEHLVSIGLSLLAFDFTDVDIVYDHVTIQGDLADVTAHVTLYISVLGQLDVYSEETMHFVLKKEEGKWLIIQNF